MKTLNTVKPVLISLAALLALSRPCTAQELELFQLDNFIEPIEFRTSISGQPAETRTFLASRALFGISHNYQYRNEFTRATVQFLHVESNLYCSTYQAICKLTGLRSGDSESVPSFKGRIGAAFYIEDTEGRTPDAKEYGPGRFGAFWGVEDVAAEGLVHELVLEADFSWPNYDPPVLGGFLYVWKPDKGDQYLGLAYRSIFHRSQRDWLYGFGVAISGERVRKITRGGVLRGELSAEIPLKVSTTALHVLYSASYHLSEKSWNNEIGIFFNAPLIARLF